MATKGPEEGQQDHAENDFDQHRQECPDETVAGQDGIDDDDGLFLLLEENAKLRELVVTLTDILLETFADQGLMRQRSP